MPLKCTKSRPASEARSLNHSSSLPFPGPVAREGARASPGSGPQPANNATAKSVVNDLTLITRLGPVKSDRRRKKSGITVAPPSGMTAAIGRSTEVCYPHLNGPRTGSAADAASADRSEQGVPDLRGPSQSPHLSRREVSRWNGRQSQGIYRRAGRLRKTFVLRSAPGIGCPHAHGAIATEADGILSHGGNRRPDRRGCAQGWLHDDFRAAPNGA